MSVNNAIKLLQVIDTDDLLRKKLYACKHTIELENCLKDHNMWFHEAEFDEAINMLHVKCQFKEQANELFQKVEWFNFLISSMQNK
jgi:hypothetical protein